MITKKLHVPMYFGVRLRKPDNTYYNLDTLTDLAFLLTLPSGDQLIARKDYNADNDDAQLKKFSTEFYYVKFLGSDTSEELEPGVGSFEVGTIVPDADITQFKAVSDPVKVNFVLSNLAEVL